MQRNVRRSSIALALATLFLAGCDRGSEPNNIGKPAPVFTMTDGVQSVDMAKLRGKVVVLNLWATWCVPCIEELPSLLAMQHKIPSLEVVAISTDQDDVVYRKYLKKYNVDVLTVRDSEQKVNALYGTVLIPETYVIDRQGIIRRKFIGPQDWTSPDILDYLNKL